MSTTLIAMGDDGNGKKQQEAEKKLSKRFTRRELWYTHNQEVITRFRDMERALFGDKKSEGAAYATLEIVSDIIPKLGNMERVSVERLCDRVKAKIPSLESKIGDLGVEVQNTLLMFETDQYKKLYFWLPEQTGPSSLTHSQIMRRSSRVKKAQGGVSDDIHYLFEDAQNHLAFLAKYTDAKATKRMLERESRKIGEYYAFAAQASSAFKKYLAIHLTQKRFHSAT